MGNPRVKRGKSIKPEKTVEIAGIHKTAGIVNLLPSYRGPRGV